LLSLAPSPLALPLLPLPLPGLLLLVGTLPLALSTGLLGTLSAAVTALSLPGRSLPSPPGLAASTGLCLLAASFGRTLPLCRLALAGRL
jgi:hypothetical protein